MDVYDSPLNKAHQQARRAEFCLAKNKYLEAIECHHKAAEYLSELTIIKLSSTEALKSILLQQDYHRRQIEIIQDKLQSVILFSQQEKFSATVEDQLEHNNCALNRAVCGGPYETMDNRHDTMLQYVLSKVPIGASDAVDNECLVKAIKIQKDDKTVIEEQQLTINNLRIHIQELRCEADQLKANLAEERNKVCLLQCLNDQLNAKVARYEAARGKDDAEQDSKCASMLEDNSGTSIDLPPLEVPKFDFELVPAVQEDNDK